MNNSQHQHDFSVEDLAWADALDEVFWYLPARGWVYLPYAAIPLVELGYTGARIDELRRGAQPTRKEQCQVRWAVGLTRAVSETLRLADTGKVLELIMKTGKLMRRRLDRESARRVLYALRKLMTATPLMEYYARRADEVVTAAVPRRHRSGNPWSREGASVTGVPRACGDEPDTAGLSGAGSAPRGRVD